MISHTLYADVKRKTPNNLQGSGLAPHRDYSLVQPFFSQASETRGTTTSTATGLRLRLGCCKVNRTSYSTRSYEYDVRLDNNLDLVN